MSAQCSPNVKKQHHVRGFWEIESRIENKYPYANVCIMHPYLELCTVLTSLSKMEQKKKKKNLNSPQ